MKNKLFFIVSLACLILCGACTEEVSQIGSGLTDGEVKIENDSVFTVTGQSVYTPQFDSRAKSNLIGRLQIPEYGELQCSYVTQMLSSGTIGMPDSLGTERVDSMKLFIRLPRTTITGDSLAPQQLRVYRLTKQLPSDINSAFNPEGYYDAGTLLGSRNYSMTALGMNDSIYKNATSIDVQVPLSIATAKEIVDAYRKDSSIFQWPASFNKYFPGIYVESSFGRGCVANVSRTDVVIYYYRIERRVFKNEDGSTYYRNIHVKDSTIVFSSAPEVLSSNNISYRPSALLEASIAEGETVLVAPAGYNVEIDFPLNEVIKKYRNNKYSMAIISDLTFEIPASTVRNDYGMVMTPYVLMVKTSELREFFAQNKLPDGKTSFWASYSSDTGSYKFDSMRDYLIEMLAKESIASDDWEFTLVPVFITTETYTDPETYQQVTVVTGCTPYMVRPTMTRMHLERAKVKFTYSLQQIY